MADDTRRPGRDTPRRGARCKLGFVKPRSSIEVARHEELERALRRLARGEDPARVLDELSRRLANRLLHAPTKALHEADGEALARLSSLAWG